MTEEIKQEQDQQALPDPITSIVDDQGNELGIQVFFKPEDSCLVFTNGGINVVLPREELTSDQARLNATLVAAIVHRMGDAAWVEDLIVSFSNKVNSSSSSEELMEKFTNG